MTPLVLCAHGTAHPDGQQTVTDIVAGVRRAAPQRRVELAFVDVQQPTLSDVVADVVATDGPPHIVPLLLSTGYHVQVDIAAVVAAHPGTTTAPALGPSDRLAHVLAARLAQAGARTDDHVVLAAAGSTRPEATADSEEMARLLRLRWTGPVRVAYGSAATPDVRTAVAAARVDAPAARTVVSSYLLGTGHFHTQLQQAGADLVTDPLGADPLVIEQVLSRTAVHHIQ